MEKEILERQWLKGIEDRIPILDEASITLVRNQIREVAKQGGLSAETTDKMALIATELAQNQLLHAKFGQIAVRKTSQFSVPSMEIIAADQGNGIEDPTAALREEVSTSGTLGAGLSSVYHLAHELDFDIRLGEGTCIWARRFEKAPAPVCCELAILGRAYPGEAISGDSGFFQRQEQGALVGVADGLGHGLLAHEASFEAIQFVRERPSHPLDSLLLQCNEHLRESRGSVMSLVRMHGDTAQIEHLGVGDIATHIYHLNQSKRFVTLPHALGQPWDARSLASESAPFAAGTVLIMFSDGLKTETSLAGRLDLMRLPAISIAQSLLENFGRSNDDAIVFVAKFKRLR